MSAAIVNSTPIVTVVELNAAIVAADGEAANSGACEIDLPPDANCARFYEAESRVRTASRAQVRQPVNARGLGRWRTYANELAPLIAELGKVDEAAVTDSPITSNPAPGRSEELSMPIYTVTTNADSGAGSLREAINSANANPGSTINFSSAAFTGGGADVITLASDLPAITVAAVTILPCLERGMGIPTRRRSRATSRVHRGAVWIWTSPI